MHPYLGLALAKEIQRDRLAEAAAHRATQQARRPLSTRLSELTRTWKPAPVLQVGRARATAPSAPMGCTA